MSLDKFRWIPGYEGLYDVNREGFVRSFYRRGSPKMRDTPVVLSFQVATNGYVLYNLHKEKKGKKFLAHRIVASTFLPNPRCCKNVCHKNDIKQDNRVVNLF